MRVWGALGSAAPGEVCGGFADEFGGSTVWFWDWFIRLGPLAVGFEVFGALVADPIEPLRRFSAQEA